MPRPLRWRSLGGGLVAVVLMIAAATYTVKNARIGQIRGKTVDVFFAGGEATAIVAGTEVWLGGKKVGNVKDVAFAPPNAPLDRRIVVRAEVAEEFRRFVRRDALADIRNAGTVIGAKVVYVSGGTHASPPVSSGDTIAILPRPGTADAMERARDLTQTIPSALSDIRKARAELHGMKSALAGVRSSTGQVTGSLAQLRARTRSGGGTAGLLMGDRTALAARISAVVARADTIRTLLHGRAEELGRFRRDTSLITALSAVQREVADLRELMDAPNGTLGRLRADSALALAVDNVFLDLSVLLEDVKRRPLRYIHVF